MNKADRYLKESIENIIKNGCKDINPRPRYKDGVPAHTFFVTHNIRTYDLNLKEFPITILRPVAWKSAIKEMLWIFQDQSNDLSLLRDKYNVHAWDSWESKDIQGTIGKRYGYTVKHYDLLNKRVLDDIATNPYGRYHIMNLWQEQDLQESDGLKPCAFETIWSVRGEYIDMFLNQRSGDMLVASGAGHWNEVQYATLLLMVAKHTGYKAGKFTHFVVNEQIYDRHLEQAEILIQREPSEFVPVLTLNTDKTNFYDISIDDFIMENYSPVKPQLSFDIGI